MTGLACLLLAAAPVTQPLPPDFPLTKAAPACPTWLTVWSFSGTFTAGDDWDAQLLEVRGDRARLAAVSIRSQVPRLPSVEADWFVSEPLPPEPSSFSISSRVYADRPLEELCLSFRRGGLDALVGRSKAELKAVEGALVIESTTAVSVFWDGRTRTGVELEPADPRPPERLPPIPYEEGLRPGPGQIVQPGLVATQTRVEERRDVTERERDPDHPVDPARAAEDEAERKALEAAHDIVVRQARSLRTLAGDLVDVPATRRALARLAQLDPSGLPKGLPSEFRLAVAGAPKDYVTALAIETLTDEESPDRLAALRWLGDQPAPGAIEDLLIILKRRPETKQRQLEAAMALRALWRATPDAARLQALRSLSGPRRVVRAAMGVFWFTEPSLRRELNALDFGNADKVRAMAARIRGHLTVNARDPELKRAASSPQSP